MIVGMKRRKKQMIKAIFKKWKEYKRKWENECQLYGVLSYISKHNAVRFDGIVQVPNCDVYLMKHSSDIMIMVKKPLWKNYIAVTKIYLEDSWGNTFSSDYYFTVSDDLKFCSKTLQDIPKEIIQEFHNELIENSTAIKETIDRKIREEYYKEN